VCADFVCLRIISMLDVDINLFKFDWDQTWAGFFMNAQGYIYARYGVRKEHDGEKTVSIAGLLDTMKKALDLHKKEAAKAPPAWKPQTIQDLASFKKDPQAPKGCAHCHHAWTYTRKNEMDLGTWKRDKLWVFPLADNLGITLDYDKNTLVNAVTGMAAKADVKVGDRIKAVNGQRVLTPADIAWILQNVDKGTVKLDLDRDGSPATASMSVSGVEWRKRDLSWRESVNVLSPQTGFWAPDAKPDERQKLGLGPDAIALKVKLVNNPGPAKAAGLMVDDVIVAVDGKTKDMSYNEFTQHIWMDKNPGSVLQFVVLRKGNQVAISLPLR
jgi:serine protease Do